MNQNQRSHAVRMHNCGNSLAAIAKKLKLSQREVEDYLKTRKGYPNERILSLSAEKAHRAMEAKGKPRSYTERKIVSKALPDNPEPARPATTERRIESVVSPNGVSLPKVSIQTSKL